MAKLGYVSVNLTKELKAVLTKEIAELGLNPITSFPYHVTVIYDERECNEPRCIINDSVIFEATVTGFSSLGKAVVMDLYSRGLNREFQRLKEAGYEHSFGNSLLHMSLVYEPDPLELEVVKASMGHWLGKTLQFTNETLRNLD